MANETHVVREMRQTFTGDQVAQVQNAALDLLAALQVILLTPPIAAWLQEHDPKALEQAVAAVALAGGRTVGR